MKAPFPYFGGKSRIAERVWAALGSDVTNYVEPFAGSLACLLARPGGAGKVETVNDYDGLLANVWRAMRHDPDAVAHHADWPVNECDLHARHGWLVGQRDSITPRLMGDPDCSMPKRRVGGYGAQEALDVHHRDGDFQNNCLSNLQRICRSCHNKEHKQRGLCVICGAPQKGLGYCDKHYQRFKKHGDPLLVKDNQFTSPRTDSEANPTRACQVTGCKNPYHANGYCGKHAQQFRRGTLGLPQNTKSQAAKIRWRSAV